MDKYYKFRKYGSHYCEFLNAVGRRPEDNNHSQADSMFETITGKPAQLMTDDQRKEINDRCHYMALTHYEDKLNNLKKREALTDHYIKWMIAGLFIGYLVIGNIAWWMVGAGVDTQTYSKKQIIEKVETWK